MLCLPPNACQSDLSLSSTATPLTNTSSTSPPLVFDLLECKNDFDTIDQAIFVCIKHPQLYHVLKYAEALAKARCEEDFQHELWNCSGFSLLREPNITRGGKRLSYYQQMVQH